MTRPQPSAYPHAPEPSSSQGAGLMAFAAVLSFAIALVHVGAAFIGPAAYRYLTAPNAFVDAALRHRLVPGLITLLIAGVFTLFGWYAWSASGRARPMPALKVILIGIASIYTLRGLTVVPETVLFLHTTQLPVRALVFSTIALLIGIVHFVALARRWPALSSSH